MKKFYLAIGILFAFSASSFAQFTPGQKILGGNLGFSTGHSEYPISSPNDMRHTNFSVSPSFGKFRKPNVLQGISLSYSYSSDKNTSTNGTYATRQSSNGVGISIFRQRFFPLASKFYFTLNGNVGGSYHFGKQTTTNLGIINQNNSRGFGAGFGLTPGLSYQLSKRVLFDATFSNVLSVMYSHSETTSGNSKAKSENFSLSSSLSNSSLGGLGLGFRLLLKK